MNTDAPSRAGATGFDYSPRVSEILSLSDVEFADLISTPVGLADARDRLISALQSVEHALASRAADWKSTRSRSFAHEFPVSEWWSYDREYNEWRARAVRFKSMVNSRLAVINRHRGRDRYTTAEREREEFRLVVRYLTRAIIAHAAGDLGDGDLYDLIDELMVAKGQGTVPIAALDDEPWGEDDRALLARLMRASPAAAAYRGTRSYRPVPLPGDPS